MLCILKLMLKLLCMLRAMMCRQILITTPCPLYAIEIFAFLFLLGSSRVSPHFLSTQVYFKFSRLLKVDNKKGTANIASCFSTVNYRLHSKRMIDTERDCLTAITNPVAIQWIHRFSNIIFLPRKLNINYPYLAIVFSALIVTSNVCTMCDATFLLTLSFLITYRCIC